jgi:hypothetical protein
VAEVSYPTTGGGAVTDARYEQLIGTVMPSGLLGSPALSSLVYADSSGRQVKVQPSRAAMVRGFRWESDGAGIVRSIAANSSGNPRIDLAVLRLNRNDFTVTFQIVQGAPAASPVAPSLTQNTGSTGVWELPLARITVANNATTLAAGAVQDISWYIGGPSLVAGTSAAPPPVTPGATLTIQETGRVFNAVGSSWHMVAENGSLTSIAAHTGWSGNIYFRRRNGWTFFQGLLNRTGIDLPAASASQLMTIPTQFRPPQDMYFVAYAGSQIMRCHIDAPTGVVMLNGKSIVFQQGASIVLHPITYPSA